MTGARGPGGGAAHGGGLKVLLTKVRERVFDYGNIYPPTNLAYVAAALEAAGATVRIVDQEILGFDNHGFTEIARDFSPAVVGFDTFTADMPAVYRYAAAAKAALPGGLVVLGGPHASALPVATLRECAAADIVVVGEGEETARDLVEWVAGGRNGDLSAVEGIGCRAGDGEIVLTPPREPLEDPDLLPMAAHRLLPLEKYRFTQVGWEGRKATTVIGARGCPYRCAYCAQPVFGRRVRARSPGSILAEITHLHVAQDVRAVMFVDDTFTLDRDRVMGICRDLREAPFDIAWNCTTSVNHVDGELLAAMASAGCKRISYGVESADPEVLRGVRKPVDLGRVKRAFDATRRAGIETMAYFMIGLPGETRRSVEVTKRFARHLDPDYITVSITTPYPGSDLYREHEDRLPKAWSRYQDIGYYTEPVATFGELGPGELRDEQRRFLQGFYLRPRYALGRVARVRSLRDARAILRKGFKVARYWYEPLRPR